MPMWLESEKNQHPPPPTPAHTLSNGSTLLTWVPGYLHVSLVARLSWGWSLRSSQQGAQRCSLPLEGQAEGTGVSEGPWDREYRGALAQEWSPALGSLPQAESPPVSSAGPGTWAAHGQ